MNAKGTTATMKTLKTFLLLTVMSILLVVIGGALFDDAVTGAAIGLGLAVVLNGVSYFKSDKIAIKMARAEPMSEADYPDVYAIVRSLSQRANEPMPRMYISPSPQLNAFATGRNPEHAVVCVNRGLYEALDREELEGVLGHELQHVYNRDILIGSVAATLATAIFFISRFGMFFGGRGRNNPLGAVGMIAMMILAPMAAMIIQAAVTRSRESHADHTGAELTRNPMALARALAKLEAGANDKRRLQAGGTPAETNSAMAHMYIAAPFGGRLNPIKLFRTHPPIPERIAALEEQARRMGQLGPGQTLAP